MIDADLAVCAILLGLVEREDRAGDVNADLRTQLVAAMGGQGRHWAISGRRCQPLGRERSHNLDADPYEAVDQAGVFRSAEDESRQHTFEVLGHRLIIVGDAI